MGGWWIRISDGKSFEIRDHAGDFSSGPELAERMGNPKTHEEIRRAGLVTVGKKGEARKKVVLRVMDDGFVRARIHGASITFEFTRQPLKAMEAIRDFGKEHLGPESDIYIARLDESGEAAESLRLKWKEFQQRYSRYAWIISPLAETGSEMQSECGESE